LLEEPAGGCDIDTQNGQSLEPPKANPRTRYPTIDEKSDLAVLPSKVQGVQANSERADHIAILPKRETHDVPFTETAEAIAAPVDAHIQTPDTPPWSGDVHLITHWKRDGSLAIRYLLSWGNSARDAGPPTMARLAPSGIFQETGNTCVPRFIERVPTQTCWIDVVMPAGWEGPLMGRVELTWNGQEQSRFFLIAARENPDVVRGFLYLGAPLLQAEPWPQGGYTATLRLRNTGNSPRQIALEPNSKETAVSAVHLLDRTCREGVVQPGEVCTQRVFVQTPAWQPVLYQPRGIGLDMGLAPQGILIRPEDPTTRNPTTPMLFVGDVCPKPGAQATVWRNTTIEDSMTSYIRSGEATRLHTQTCTWQPLFNAGKIDVLACKGQATYETVRMVVQEQTEEVYAPHPTPDEPKPSEPTQPEQGARPSLVLFDEHGNPAANPQPMPQTPSAPTPPAGTTPITPLFDEEGNPVNAQPPIGFKANTKGGRPNLVYFDESGNPIRHKNGACKPHPGDFFTIDDGLPFCDDTVQKEPRKPGPSTMDHMDAWYPTQDPEQHSQTDTKRRKRDLVAPLPGMENPFTATNSEGVYTLERAATIDVERTAALPLSCIDGRVSNGWISTETFTEGTP
jgi:hypothetical protein